MKFSFEELVMFSAVAEHKSFTLAAEHLNQAAPAISRGIKKLESKLQCSLFHRTTRNVEVTSEGEWLFQHTSEIRARLADIERYFIEEGQQPSGVVRIDAATPFTLHAIAPLIPRFNQLYPEVTVELESTESNINLIERKVDLALRIGELDDSSLKAKKLGTTTRGIYASPEYLQKHGFPRSPEDLRKHACLGFSKAKKLNSWPIKGTNDEPVLIEPSVLADSGETLRQLALKNSGIACLSAFTVKEDLKAGRLISLLENELIDTPIPIHLVFYADKAVSARVRCFIDYLTKHIDLNG